MTIAQATRLYESWLAKQTALVPKDLEILRGDPGLTEADRSRAQGPCPQTRLDETRCVFLSPSHVLPMGAGVARCLC